MKAKLTVKSAVCPSLPLQHMAFLTVNLAFALTSGATKNHETPHLLLVDNVEDVAAQQGLDGHGAQRRRSAYQVNLRPRTWACLETYSNFVRFLQKRSQTGKASESWLFQTHNRYDSASFSSLASFLEKTNEVG